MTYIMREFEFGEMVEIDDLELVDTPEERDTIEILREDKK